MSEDQQRDEQRPPEDRDSFPVTPFVYDVDHPDAELVGDWARSAEAFKDPRGETE